jgi:hypothetical protein
MLLSEKSFYVTKFTNMVENIKMLKLFSVKKNDKWGLLGF